jgi:hypothetical protein
MFNQKGLAPVLIIIILAAVLGGGFLVYQNQNKLQQKKIEENTPPPVVDSSSWSIANYELCKLSLKYPPGWTIKHIEISNIVGSDGQKTPNCSLELNDPKRGPNSPISSFDIRIVSPRISNKTVETYTQSNERTYSKLKEKGWKVETFNTNIGGKDYTFFMDETNGQISGYFENFGEIFKIGGVIKENNPQTREEVKEIVKTIRVE